MSYKLPEQINLDAEAAVLGACLIPGGDAFKKLSGRLLPEHFSDSTNKIIFETFQTLATSGTPIDLVTVCGNIGREHYPQIRNGVYISELLDSVPTAAHVEFYAKQVLEAFTLRQIAFFGRGVTTDAESENKPASEILEASADKIKAIAASEFDRQNGYPLQNLILDRVDEIQEGRVPDLLKTGFVGLDEKIGGLSRGALVTLAARTSSGKTSFAVCMAHNFAKQKLNVAFYTLEMSRKEIIDRLISTVTAVPLENIRSMFQGDNTKGVTDKISREFIHADLSLTILEPRPTNYTGIVSSARQLAAARPLDVIVIDQLSRIDALTDRENDREKINYVVKNLKTLAQELNCVVVLLHQLNRDVDKAKGERLPVLSDLKDSGKVEEESDLVLMLHRKFYSTGDKAHINDVQVIVAKNRNGATGSYSGLEFIPHLTLFREKSSGGYLPPFDQIAL